MTLLYQYTIKIRFIIFLILCISCLPRAAYTQLKITNLVPDKYFGGYLSRCNHAIKKWDGSGYLVTHFTYEYDTVFQHDLPCINGIQLYDISDSGEVIKKYQFNLFEINNSDSIKQTLNGYPHPYTAAMLNLNENKLILFLSSTENTYSLITEPDSTTYLKIDSTTNYGLKATIDIGTGSITFDTLPNNYYQIGPPSSNNCFSYWSSPASAGRLCENSIINVKTNGWDGGVWGDTVIDINSNKWGIYFAKYNFSGEQIGKTDTMLRDTIDGYDFGFNPIRGFSVFPNQKILCETVGYHISGNGRKKGIAIFDNNFNLVNIVFSSYDIISINSLSGIMYVRLTPQNTFIAAGNVDIYKNIWMMEFTPEGEILWEHIYPYGFSFPPNTVHDIIAEEDALYLLMSNWKENFSDNPEYYQYWFVKFTRDGLGGTLSNEQTEPITKDNELATVYPNPSNGLYYLNLFTPARELSYRVFDVNGTLITSGKIQGASQGEIDIRDHPPGMYFISLIDTERKQVQTLKLIKMN